MGARGPVLGIWTGHEEPIAPAAVISLGWMARTNTEALGEEEFVTHEYRYNKIGV